MLLEVRTKRGFVCPFSGAYTSQHGRSDGRTEERPQSSSLLRTGVCLLVTVCLALVACTPGASGEADILTLNGPSMGTRYVVKIAGANKSDHARLSQTIETELNRLNRIFSTYTPDSEISILNQAERTGDFEVSAELWRVMKRADEIAEASGGAFDMTVAPLVNLWGFSGQTRPSFAQIERELLETKAYVGRNTYELVTPGVVRKHHPRVSFDLSGIAKGYAVDVLAKLLSSRGFSNFLVEIGGEIRVAGAKPGASGWRLGLEAPQAETRAIVQVLELSNQALASSGDYRNYFEYEGTRYSHLIDPRSGYPTVSKNFAVNVIAENCMEADAWATALSILGPEQGLTLAAANKLAAQMVVGNTTYKTEKFEALGF